MNNIAKQMGKNIRNSFAEDMGRWRKFVTSHEAGFIILGAFIVFLGFVVREGYQQEDKDLASAIGSAYNTFAIRTELQQVDFQIRALRANDKDYGEIDSLKHSGAPSLEEVQQLLVMGSWALTVQETALASAEDLYEKLPDKPNDLVDYEHRASDGVKDLEEANKKTKDSLEQIRKEASNGKPAPESLDRLAVLARAAGIAAALHVNTFGQFTLIEAQHVHGVAEINADLATKGSYVLFTLGWALGLMGKLFKIPALGAAEE